MKHFGIIGYPLHHSFSAQLFSEKFLREGIDAEYTLYPIETIEAFPALLRRVALTGLNVTMPYKEQVIPYLDQLDDTAKAIGAVNVIRVQHTDAGPLLTGYNTDVLGFEASIQPMLLPTDTAALVLGTGGAAKAVAYGLQRLGLQVEMVSRSAERGLTYDQLTPEVVMAHTVVVNCTPLGMVPDICSMPPFPVEWLTRAHIVYDVIYNPEKTRFMQAAEQQGCRVAGGKGMLLGQARAAWGIWTMHDA